MKFVDVLIVFLCKKVFQIVVKLEKDGYKVSVIYGSMLFEMRRK